MRIAIDTTMPPEPRWRPVALTYRELVLALAAHQSKPEIWLLEPSSRSVSPGFDVSANESRQEIPSGVRTIHLLDEPEWTEMPRRQVCASVARRMSADVLLAPLARCPSHRALPVDLPIAAWASSTAMNWIDEQTAQRGVRSSFRSQLWLRRAHEAEYVIVCDSRTSKQRLIDQMHFPKTQLGVVHATPMHRLTQNKKADLSRIQRFGVGKNFALHDGSDVDAANTHRVMEAWAMVPSAYRKDAQLLIFGLSPESIADLTAAAGRIGSGTILLTGPLKESDRAALFTASRALIQPDISMLPGTSTRQCVMDAWASQTPVLTSVETAYQNFVGSAGILTDPQDPMSMSTKIRRLLYESPVRMNLRQEGLTAASIYSQTRTAQAMLEVLDHTIKLFHAEAV